ncbi:dual specificity protein kinase Ttk-like [Myxocyprinus asiaticus]|uniref:dual specificity protein kinase Ttk-like n=1 Tax=Myxocyprinus asiaticus TaxID=70543 RepID=UPI0022226268|nr:dual specificity protein kinase Ttk-like [Myxocyprinus asiaticus]XP_051577500.1 dual specificity protein kinase Ttk-like [Myxocyprinus asiaticus]
MDEEESTERQMQIAMLCQRLAKMKQLFNDDDTDYINQAISSNSPDTCQTFLTNLEKKGNPQSDHSLLTKLIDSYTRVFSSMPLGKYSQNESYAKMLVRFAELKAIQDVNDAQASFDIARSHCKDFAFVHIAYAQFELLQGNVKKCTLILQKAFEMNAKPRAFLEAAVRNLNLGKCQLISHEDKENISVSSHENAQESLKSSSRRSDGTFDLQARCTFTQGNDQKFSPQDENLPVWRSGSQQRRITMADRVPMVPLSIPENENSDSESVQKPEAPTYSSSFSRQTQGSGVRSTFPFCSSKKATSDRDSYSLLNLKPPVISPDHLCEDIEEADTITELLHKQERKETARMDDTTVINQMISSDSPESCQIFLRNLEKRGDPRSDPAFLSRLLDCYSKVFARFPLAKHSKTESYAQMLVRYAELKGIEDPEDAQDNFSIARSHCKAFAFVHIAHAQFELSQGNFRKSNLILQKALSSNARPVELLQTAMKHLNAGQTQLLPAEDEQNTAENVEAQNNRKEEYPAKVPEGQQKPPVKETSSEWKIPAVINRHASPEDRKPPADLIPASSSLHALRTPSAPAPPRLHPTLSCQTPNYKDPNANSFVTPVVKQRPVIVSVPSTAQKLGHAQLPCTPQSQVSYIQHQSQTPASAFSNESITIKGKQFFVFKMIGRGGSSKVYQVYDSKKHVYALKYVNLEEADAQAVESYKNEIEHLNHLQQYSDQIIKLYDYEINNSYIYMLMECGHLDLNTWLRNRKSVNPLDRKCYWRNMLEAVHTIHKHGIIHSDLKPANFVIVDASLKLIDFGIANRIQPDMTSIMKDSQVGTLNYMPPEAIKDTSSNGKPGSKISAKGDVWSLGCILYCMTYGKTPFQTITNQIAKIHAIIDQSHEIDFPDIPEKDLLDVLKRCLVRNPRERISIAELLEHPYLQLQPQPAPDQAEPCNSDLKRILNELAALQSPNSIARAASNLAKMCNSGKKLDVSECVKTSTQTLWK